MAEAEHHRPYQDRWESGKERENVVEKKDRLSKTKTEESVSTAKDQSRGCRPEIPVNLDVVILSSENIIVGRVSFFIVEHCMNSMTTIIYFLIAGLTTAKLA